MQFFPKDINIKIMNELDDRSLCNLCKTNKAADKICKDDNFWRIRINSIFKDRTKEVLKFKEKGQTHQDFYKSEKFKKFRNITFPICEEISNFPNRSQLVVDDFYNPYSGHVSRSYTLDDKGMVYLLLKIVLERMEKDVFRNFEEEEKLKTAIDKTKKEIPDYREDSFDFDTYDLTKKEKEYFYDLIRVELDRSTEIVKKIHNGFQFGEIPLDIKWDELCTHPYFYK